MRPGPFLVGAMLMAAGGCWASEHCVTRIDAAIALLGEGPLAWRETTMDDGKPLVMVMADERGTLALRFHKTGEGLWAEGRGPLCRTAEGLEARLPAGSVHAGPAANWLLRRAMASGMTFRIRQLPSGGLRVSGAGWSGDFARHAVP